MTELDLAQHGDAIQGADLQNSVGTLRRLAASLRPLLKTERDPETIRSILRIQQRLLDFASSLVIGQICLMAGEAKVTAAHIQSAITYSNAVLARVADVKTRIEQFGVLVDFLAAVSTGQGANIVEAAWTLRSALDQPSKDAEACRDGCNE